TARHRHDEVVEQRAKREVFVTGGVRDDGAVRQPDEGIVVDRAAMGVEYLAALEDDRVQARLGARQLHLVAESEGAAEAHRGVSFVRVAASTAARSSALRPSSVVQRV